MRPGLAQVKISPSGTGNQLKIFKHGSVVPGLKLNEDIAIQVTGLRPGEKLHESLVCEMETVKSTPHPKLKVVSGQCASFDVCSQTISVLSEVIREDTDTKQLWHIAQQCKVYLENSYFPGETLDKLDRVN